MPIHYETKDPIAYVTVDNPPVNATSRAVRQGLWEAADRADADEAVKAVLLTCTGRTFVAGADVSEFGVPPMEPHLPDLINRIEGATTPWIAALHGTVLGAGLELALSCRFRIADPSAKMGMPEVALGLIPGAGGTVRLPRLVPALVALEMVTTGKPISAPKALEFGLVDELADGPLPEAAQTFAAKVLTQGTPPALIDRSPAPVDWEAFDAKAQKITAKTRGQNAPQEAVSAIRRALTQPPEAALEAERATFLRLRDDPQCAALRHVFFAERATTRIPRLKGVKPRAMSQIGVIGGGTMGAGIAAASLLAGLETIMIERDAEAADLGRARVVEILAASKKRGLISDEKLQHMLGQFQAAAEYDALKNADLVIEAVFEDMAVKQDVFAELDRVLRPDAVLASNTSYLDLNSLAEASKHPERVLGLHFFSPAHIMKLLEIVVPNQVSDDVLATGVALAKKLRKTAVLAGVCDGFIANRIMSAYRRECEYMLEDGALPEQIDRAMVEFGLPMGVFQMQDLAGLDIGWAMRKRRAATRPKDERYVDIPDKLCDAGWLGRKAGRGYYRYHTGKAEVDPEVTALILSESARKGIKRRDMSDADIMSRILATMQREGAVLLAEGIAQSADDIDVAMIYAYGFPCWRGGPMFMRIDADRQS